MGHNLHFEILLLFTVLQFFLKIVLDLNQFQLLNTSRLFKA